MCFSAEASFTLSAVLLPAGIFCLRSAETKEKATRGLAVIPILFAMQQFAEGLVWTGLNHRDAWLTRLGAQGFLFFALAFWPFWIPFCAFLLEPSGWRRTLLGSFAGLGLAGGLVLFVPLIVHPDMLSVEATHHSIYYDITRSYAMGILPFEWWQAVYLLLVATPPLLASARGFYLFGVGIVVSAAISQIFFWYASASVWCFFAAILSLYLCFCFHRLPGVVRQASP